MIYNDDDSKFNSEKYIKGGDLIRLQHTGNKGYLAAERPFKLDQPEVFIRKYKGKFKEEAKSASSLWEVEMDEAFKRGNSCVIKYFNAKGSMIYNSFKLRHFVTGKLLSSITVLIHGRKSTIPILGHHPEVIQGSRYIKSKVEFMTTRRNQDNQLKYNDCYMIMVEGEYLKPHEDLMY